MPDFFDRFDALDPRADRPRTFRIQRQRLGRRKSAVDAENHSAAGQSSKSAMPAEEEEEHQQPPRPMSEDTDRATLCLPHFGKDKVVHRGDEGFTDVLRQYFPTAESAATDRLVALKAQLRAASTHDFWAILMEEMCNITESQCGFVAKRMLVDDQDSAVEMPEFGEPGSCLMGVAFYVNNDTDVKQLYRDYRYHAYGTPCEHMKHDKVFIVPERMTEFVRDNPNKVALPWERSEAFIGVPLFSEASASLTSG